MNILVIGKFYTEGFAQHIAESLVEMGHNVVRFQPGKPYRIVRNKFDGYREKFLAVYHSYLEQLPISERINIKKIDELLENQPIDFVLCCHDFLTPGFAKHLKAKTKAPLALWFPDAISNFRKAMFLVADYDFLFFKEPFVVPILQDELSVNAFYLPECCHASHHNKVAISEADKKRYNADLATAGNMHAARIAFFRQLVGYDIKIWGNKAPKWADVQEISNMFQHHFVVNEEKAKAFLCSKIVLNNLHPTEVFGINVRTFEIAAAGAFQIASWRQEMPQFYEIDREIVTFKTLPELKEKIDYYLANDAARDAIAQRAYERTHREHTYEHRLNLMFDTVFKGAKGFQILENNLF